MIRLQAQGVEMKPALSVTNSVAVYPIALSADGQRRAGPALRRAQTPKVRHISWCALFGSMLAAFGISHAAADGQPGSQPDATAHSAPAADADTYADGLRKWTPRDSVAVRYFDPEDIVVSPDGKYFFFVSFHGDLACDCDIYDLSVYSSAEVRDALAQNAEKRSVPQPFRHLVRRSFGRETFAIAFPRWEPRSASILFQGVNEHGILQLYRWSVLSGKLTALTDWQYEPLWMTKVGETIVGDLFVPQPSRPPTYPYEHVTRDMLRGAILSATQENRRLATFVSYPGRPMLEIRGTDPMPAIFPEFTSDGRRAIAIRRTLKWPSHWDRYDGLVGDNVDRGRTPRFVLIDAEHGFFRPVFDAPTGSATRVGAARASQIFPEALWASDQQHVVLVNTALPLEGREHAERTKMAYIVGFDTDNGQWEVIEPLESRGEGGALRQVKEVGWLKPGEALLVRHEVSGKAVSGNVYTLQHGHWIGHAVDSSVKVPAVPSTRSTSLPDGLSVTLRQSANEPPVVLVSDGKHEISLTGPDPALVGVWWGRSRPFTWAEPSGRKMTAGLLLPRESSDTPIPLVIQAYRYEPDRFTPDGPYRHIYAAQALLSRGMAVLNIDIPTMDIPSVRNSPQELTEFVERVDSVADSLAAQGLIDRKRVGLVGFSRAGYNIYYAITHPGTTPPAAAIIDDSFPGTYYYSIVLSGLTTVPDSSLEKLYGGSFWDNKAAWLDREPSFNLDKATTPVLMTLHGEQNLFHAIEAIGEFSLTKRALEYVVFPGARHQLHKPRQRAASLELTVDWMSFWLQGYEDPEPGKADQYVRWRAMRKAQK